MWFAFKLISLSYWIQRNRCWQSKERGCDLLSNLYLCHIEYSKIGYWSIFGRLWFAFKLISLSYWIQLHRRAYINTIGCDLLSNLYLCHIEYSITDVLLIWVYSCDLLSNLYLCHIEYSNQANVFWVHHVVICFQTYIFVILNTAFVLGEYNQERCDLLSNLYLCHIEYS